MLSKSGLALLLIVGSLLAVAAVSAKFEPYIEDPENEWGSFDDAAWQAPAALPFYGLYGHLASDTDVDTFVFDFDEAVTAFLIQVIVPVCGTHFEDFYPSIALVGPGLDVPEDVELPFELPEGAGALVLTEIARSHPRPIVREGVYSRSDYFSLWHSVDIPEAGEYTVAVWEPDGREGAYVLATGREHPEMDFADKEREKERLAAYNQIESGSWINYDCSAKVS